MKLNEILPIKNKFFVLSVVFFLLLLPLYFLNNI